MFDRLYKVPKTLAILLAGVTIGSPALAETSIPGPIQSAGIEMDMYDTKPFGDHLFVHTGVLPDGSPVAIYTDEEQSFALVGMALDAEGKNLTVDHLGDLVDEYRRANANDSTMNNSEPVDPELFAKLSEADYHTVGSGESVIYVMHDPACPHCVRLYEQIAPEVENIEWRFLPVALLSRNEPERAAKYLDGDVDAVRANTQLSKELGARATPTLFFEDPVTGKPMMRAGVPSPENLAPFQ